jgi:hypothetical protein
MAVTTTSGTKVWIGPVTSNITDTAAEYIALTPYVLIGEVESYGDFGDSASDVTFTSVGDARVRHFKGARDAGTLSLTIGRDPVDAGQIALKAAELTKFEYAIKIEAADAPDADSTNTVYYFRGLVRTAKSSYGTNDNVVKIMAEIGINSPILEIPPAEIV